MEFWIFDSSWLTKKQLSKRVWHCCHRQNGCNLGVYKMQFFRRHSNYWYCPSKMIPVDSPGWFHTGRPLEGKQFPLQAREQVTLNAIAIIHQPIHHWITLTRISPASNCGGTWERLFSERFKRVIMLLLLLLFALVWKSCFCHSLTLKSFHDTRSASSPAEI